MYKVQRAKPAWQVQCLIRDHGIRDGVIRVEPECLAIKQKGRRTWYRLPYTAIYDLAAWAHAEKTRRDRIKARKQRSGGGVQRGRLR
jgi:hypothetical protein